MQTHTHKVAVNRPQPGHLFTVWDLKQAGRARLVWPQLGTRTSDDSNFSLLCAWPVLPRMTEKVTENTKWLEGDKKCQRAGEFVNVQSMNNGNQWTWNARWRKGDSQTPHILPIPSKDLFLTGLSPCKRPEGIRVTYFLPTTLLGTSCAMHFAKGSDKYCDIRSAFRSDQNSRVPPIRNPRSFWRPLRFCQVTEENTFSL